MPKKPSTGDGKSKKKKKKSRDRSASGTEEKGLPPDEINPDDNLATETKPQENTPPCSINIRIPPPMLCMRTAVPKRAPTRTQPRPSGSKSLCPTIAAVSNPAAFCPPGTGQAPCPVVRSRSCGPDACIYSQNAGQPQSQPFQPQSQSFQPEGFQPQQEFQQTEVQQQFPPQPYQQPQQAQSQELQSQAPIIVCSASQLSLAQRIAAEGTLPPPEVVSSQSRACSPACQQTLARSMPSVPNETQFQPAPPAGYYGMEGDSSGLPAGGQWARSLPNFDGAVCSQEVDRRDSPMPGLEGPSYSGQQPFYQSSAAMPPPSGDPGNQVSQWSESFPICCSPSDSSAATLQVPVNQDVSHIVTIDIRVRAVQKPPSGLSINKAPNEEGLLNQQIYPGGSQNRMPVDTYPCDPQQRPPSGAMRMPETPPTSAEVKYSDCRDVNPPGGLSSPAFPCEVPPENNQQIQRDQPVSSGPVPCPFKNQTGQSRIPGRNDVCASQSQGFDTTRQIVRCPSLGTTFPPHFPRGQRYACTSSQESQRWAPGGQAPYPPPQQSQFSPTPQEMSAPGSGPMQFQNIPPGCRSASLEPRPLSSSSCVPRSPCLRMPPNPCRLQNDQTGSVWLRPRSGSDPRFQTSQCVPRRAGGSILNSILDVLPSISALRGSRPSRSIRMAEPSESDETQDSQNPDNVEYRTRKSRSETPGSRTQEPRGQQSVQYPPINSTSEGRRKRRSMS